MDTPKSVFSKIIDRELPAEIVLENERLIVIPSIDPVAPVHLLAITKHPYLNLDDLLAQNPEEGPGLLWELFSVLHDLAEEYGVKESGYKIVANNGPDSGQSVPHLHVHLLGGRRLHDNT